MLDSYFSSLEQYISKVKDVPVRCLRSPSDGRCPTLDEVEDAKRSLKECLSDLFKLFMNDRLADALSTLSMAEVGLSASQARSVRSFWDRIEEFTLDFLSFEQDNAEFQLQMLLKDLMFSKMKMCHEQYLTFKKLSKQLAEVEEGYERKIGEVRKMKKRLEQDILFKNLSEQLAEEEEECERKIEELSERKEKLVSDWEVLLAESQEAKSKYAEHEMKAKDAEEKKRVAEERMSRSTMAWSSLKHEFA
ncbi:hypothetical protein MLD38_020169 [Melastoma candidum]|uniref:Uncharacterized protein n=1 Tax=Melastoma candidum TaxID=119954 RepID=A0ACB9QF32_9MYRT|nr:hypothetical protein MLD38_020169 [Melastoma candidum]